jgi:hypothetical protein
MYVDQSAEFWPTGWAVWFSIVLGTVDLALVMFVVSRLLWR